MQRAGLCRRGRALGLLPNSESGVNGGRRLAQRDRGQLPTALPVPIALSTIRNAHRLLPAD